MLTHKGTQTIETSRLILRRAVREDAELMFRNWASDPEVTKYLTWPAHETVETSAWVLNSWVGEYEKNQLLSMDDRAERTGRTHRLHQCCAPK